NVQDGTVVHVMRETHPTTIGDNVTIGHGAVIHGCAIEDQCLVGMGAILLNGVRIGSRSIVAAGSRVTEGTHAPPPWVLLGRPAGSRWEWAVRRKCAVCSPRPKSPASRRMRTGTSGTASITWPGSATDTVPCR